MDDFGLAHEGGEVEGGVAIAISPLEVGFVLKEEGGDLGLSVEGRAAERCHAVLAVAAVDDVAGFQEVFDSEKTSIFDDSLQAVSKLVRIFLERLGDITSIVGDMENEVVAEKSLGILDLEEVDALGGKGIEFDGNGFGFFLMDGGGNASAVDDDVGLFGHVASVERHRFLILGQDGEMLSAALFVQCAEGPECGLMEGEAGLGSVAGGEGAGEQSLFGKIEKLLSGEIEALAIDLEVAVILELKSERDGFLSL